MASLTRILIFGVVIFYAGSGLLFSQDQEINPNSFKNIIFREEILVHSDRDIYIVGERVFLKIFKLNGFTRTPVNLSQVVYVELLDGSGNPLTQLKLGIDRLSGSCDFRLPESLETGSYLIRSCTRWMQNFSSEMFSYKRISVINPFETVSRIKLPSHLWQPDSVAFYPESGSIVRSFESIIGFRCFDNRGEPTGISGYIVDSGNDTLCSVKCDSRGYGFFLIRPDNKEKIFLIEGGNRKNPRKFQLPNVKDSGLVFTINNEPDSDNISVEISGSQKENNDLRKLFLIYSAFNAIDLKKELPNDTWSRTLLKKESLPEGLAKIKITDENGLSLAERWVYNEKRDAVSFDVKLDKSNYSSREKVRIRINATDPSGKPVGTDLSISVAKSFSFDKTRYSNTQGYSQLPILSALEADSRDYDINDYLIFYRQENNNNNIDRNKDFFPLYLPELRGHIVTGQIRSTITGEPLRDINAVLSFVGEKATCRFSKTDSTGHFNFVINDHGTREIVIQPLSPDIMDYVVEIDNPFPDIKNRYRAYSFYPDSSILDDINKAVISMQVQNVYEPYKKSYSSVRDADERDFYGEPDDTILISRYIELSSLREIIKEIVPWVLTYRKKGQSKFKIISGPRSLPFDSDPLTLVDGIPVFDIDKILEIDPQDLNRIEILQQRYLISDIIIEGIIHFITYRHNLSSIEFEKPLFRREFDALQPVKAYSFPEYSNDTITLSRIPDFRNTMYWNPELKTKDDGCTTVEFYTSDEPGEYTIVVEGITAEGRTGRYETKFFVNGKPNR